MRPSSRRALPSVLLSVIVALLGCKSPSLREPGALPPAATSGSTPKTEPALRPDTPDAEFRAHPPAVGPRRAAKPPPVVEGRLKNGARLLIVELHDVPTVSFQVVLRWPERTAALSVPWLTEILRARDVEGERFTSRVSRVSGSLPHVRLTRDSLHIATNTTPDALDRVFATLGSVLRPLDPKEVDAFGGVPPRAAAIEELANDRLFTGESSYRARLTAPVTTRAVRPSSADVVHLLSASATGANLVFVAVGDTTVGELVPRLEAAFGAFPAGTLARPGASAFTPGKLVVLDTPALGDRAQVAVVAAAPPAGHKDFPAVQIASHVLNERLLSRRDFSSRGYSRLEASGQESLWLVGAAVSAPAAKRGAELLLAAVRDLDAVTVDEVEQAKRPWIEWTETMLERKTDIAWSVAHAAVQGLSFGEMAKLHDAFVALTAKDVAEVARARFDRRAVSLAFAGAYAPMTKLDKLGFGAPAVFVASQGILEKIDLTEGSAVLGRLQAR